MEIKIETASIRQLETLVMIEATCFDQEAFTKQQIAYLLTDYNAITLIAKVDSETAGFIIAEIETEKDHQNGHIITINVLPSYRRMGIGTKMLLEIETILKQKRITECHLEAREDNLAAQALYQKRGYLKIRRLDNYYGNKHGLYFRKIL